MNHCKQKNPDSVELSGYTALMVVLVVGRLHFFIGLFEKNFNKIYCALYFFIDQGIISQISNFSITDILTIFFL